MAFDTKPAARKVQLKAVQEMSKAKRAEVAAELSEAMMRLSRDGVRPLGEQK